MVLTWSTTSETNSDYFDIERSTDGKQWQKIGSVTAQGESDSLHHYIFEDQMPVLRNGNKENLYRLKMVDRDGSFAVSRIRSVTFTQDNKTDLFPNPVTVGQELNLLTDDLSKISDLKFYDSAGKLVFQSKALKQISTKGLESGLYIIEITYTDGSLSTHRIVKQ